MSSSIHDTLLALPLFGRATLHGVTITRASLFGFRVGAEPDLWDAAEAARRCVAPRRCPPPARATPAKARVRARVEVCFRCGGDGLGRRDRGVCAVCHGGGVQVITPAAGWDGAPRDQVQRATAQIGAALQKAPPDRARRSLEALLAELSPRAA